MNEVEELQGLESACRLCLTTDETRSSIFGATQTVDPLIDKIENCLSLQISLQDKLSTLICITCVNKVNQWHQYKKSCLESQDKLLQWLAKQSEPLPIITVKEEPQENSEENLQLQKNPEKIINKEAPKEIEASSEKIAIEVTENAIKIVDNVIEEFTNVETQKEIIENGQTEEIAEMPEVNPNPETAETIAEIKNPEIHNESSTLDGTVEPEPENNTENQMEVESQPEPEPRETAKRRLSNDFGNDPKRLNSIPIKTEPQEECDLGENIENPAMLTNPVAVTVADPQEQILPNSTTETKVSFKTKKKIRRGPHTHFRGARIFKRKCMHCQINLHSKTSYAKHMARFHSGTKPKADANSNLRVNSEPGNSKGAKAGTKASSLAKAAPVGGKLTSPAGIKTSNSVEEAEELIEDVEEELENLEEDAPLTPVQQNIISQLKTFTCYTCQQSFQDRRSTLNHIRQHMPDLRAFTCVACLMEFADRNTYKQHCEASFECAMKIALVVPVQGTEKYFTCNMCQRPLTNRKELVSHLTKHSDKQYEELISPTRPPPKLTPMTPSPSSLPYGMGDPAYNHECDLCGMIYRYKSNMVKHRELCASLQPEGRTSYKCIDCGMTFLIFSKFHSHVTTEHKKKELKCPKCAAKFRSPSDYLTHHEFHRKKNNLKDPQVWASAEPEEERKKFTCSLCNLQFVTRSELMEHKNLHLKVKIYSCVICRSMFSSAGALEVHMKDHGIEDPGERTANSSCMEYGQGPTAENSTLRKNECFDCGKTFSNLANLRRHVRNAHGDERRIECAECKRSFKNKESFDEHMRLSHNSPEKMVITCPECPKTFVFQANLDLHRKNVHATKEKGCHECEICGKTFAEESSLKIHRGWHNRANSRFSLENYEQENAMPSVSKPAKARKSFPTVQSYQQPQQPVIELQCQVCDDKFVDVADLRKHVWDVHCARTSKTEKQVREEKCELCLKVFPDEQTLQVHLEWHERNSVVNDNKTFRCDICDKYYSSSKILWRHKKLHKVSQAVKFQSVPMKKPVCNYCGRTFAAESALKRHKAMSPECQGYAGRVLNQDTGAMDPARKKPVTCHICKMVFPSMSILYQHKQLAHKTFSRERTPINEFVPLSDSEGINCNICGKHFPGITNLKQHYTIKHKNVTTHPCLVANCNLVFSTPHALKSHELQHSNMIYSCTMCERHFFNKGIIDKHIFNTHRAVYESVGPDKESTLYKETDLSTYTVKGASGTVCPRCKIKYPNLKAMKIHYFKFHETFD